MPPEAVYCPCRQCLSRVRVNQRTRRQHIQRHGLPDDNSSEESNDRAISSPSSPGLVPQDLNNDQNDNIEDWEEPLSDTDMDSMDEISETIFNYQRFTQIELPPLYKCNLLI